jgi:hypothetical protein
MKKSFLFALVSAALALPVSAEVDCLKLALSVKNSVAADQDKVLEIVSKEVSAASGCACEIVKAAIEGSGAKPETVASIVEAAVNAAPDQIRMIAQCAVAVAPDALADVQAVLAKLDPNKGESADSAKGAKAPAGEVAAMPNPLDFPGSGPVAPINGGPGGFPLIPVFPPVIINPPEVTEVD